ncbi:MAG: BlaI/MecI/CopY family transcriptional regulator [Bacteroidota bacterium]
MKELTKAEEQVMQVMWKIRKGFINDLLEHFPEPKPAYNTVSTIVRILEKKGFVKHRAFGKTHEYYPAVAKESYKKDLLGGLMKNYFDNSVKQMVSFFTKDNSLSINEIDELLHLIELEKEKQSKK